MINMEFSACQNTETNNYQKYDQEKLNYLGCYSISEDVSRNFNRKNLNRREGLVDCITGLVENISKHTKNVAKTNKGILAINIDCDQKIFPIVARALLHLHHIKVEKVDQLPNPHRITLSWNEEVKNIENSDFIFKVRGSQQIYPCHKNVLINKSSFFKKELRERTTQFEFQEQTFPETVEFILSYLYDKVKEVPLTLSMGANLQLQEFSTMFGLNDLHNKCKESLVLIPLAMNIAQEIINFLIKEGHPLYLGDYQIIGKLACQMDMEILKALSKNRTDEKINHSLSMEKWKILSNYLFYGDKAKAVHEGIDAVNVALDEKKGIYPEKGNYLAEVSRLLQKFSSDFKLKLVEDIKIG